MLGCLYCPRRIARTKDRHGVRVAVRRGLCEACMVHIKSHHLDQEKLIQQGLLLPPKKNSIVGLFNRKPA